MYPFMMMISVLLLDLHHWSYVEDLKEVNEITRSHRWLHLLQMKKAAAVVVVVDRLFLEQQALPVVSAVLHLCFVAFVAVEADVVVVAAVDAPRVPPEVGEAAEIEVAVVVEDNQKNKCYHCCRTLKSCNCNWHQQNRCSEVTRRH